MNRHTGSQATCDSELSDCDLEGVPAAGIWSWIKDYARYRDQVRRLERGLRGGGAPLPGKR